MAGRARIGTRVPVAVVIAAVGVGTDVREFDGALRALAV